MSTELLGLGRIMLSASERRLEVVSRNVANVSTPGFKKEATFGDALALGAEGAMSAAGILHRDFGQGALQATNSPLDLAISGEGMFRVRSGDSFYYTRSGQFERAVDGRIVNADGMALQAADGGDLILDRRDARVLQDGTVLEDGLPVARISLFQAEDGAAFVSVSGSLFAIADGEARETGAPIIRQGMIEAANVEMAGEMVEMMAALRQAEAGARLVQTYDSLIGQAITAFGQK